MRTWLLDTGPLVSYLDPGDRHHDEVAGQLNPFVGRLATTSAVLTEAMYFVAGDRRGPRLLAEFAVRTELDVHDFCEPPDLRIAAALMERYADTPMDFADATLVLLAEGLGAYDVLTHDRRGFTVYRTRAGRSLRIV